MNKVELLGRLTRDPSISYTQGQEQMCIARYTLAVDRRRSRDGEAQADFISIVSFGKAGEFIEKYAHKGTKLAIIGRIQTGQYTNKDGQKVYTTDVVTEEIEFAESKSSQGQQSSGPQQDIGDGFMNIPDGIDEELPFN